MWYRFSMSDITDLYCPDCAGRGIKSELVRRKNRTNGNEFMGCSNYPRCKYIKERLGANPPISKEKINAIISGSEPHQPSQQQETLYCPVCARQGKTSPTNKIHIKNRTPFYGCSTYGSSNYCGYVSYNQNEKPLTSEQLAAVIEQGEYQQKQTPQQNGIEQPVPQGEWDASVVKNKKPIDFFKELPITNTEIGVCPFGHGPLKETKKGNLACYECGRILKQYGGEGYALSPKDKPSLFMIYDKKHGDKYELLNGEPRGDIKGYSTEEREKKDDIKAPEKATGGIIEDTITTIDEKEQEDLFAFYKEAHASPEDDKGQGSIQMGDLFIMSDEERVKIPIDMNSFYEEMMLRAEQLEQAKLNYIDLQNYMDQSIEDRIALEKENIGDNLIIGDHGIYNQEECEAAKLSSLYQYTEISINGYTPNPSQAKSLKLLEKTNNNMILCLPTGVGKTTIAEAAIADGKLKAQKTRMKHPIAVYICPARALAAQIAKDFSAKEHPFAKMGWDISLVRGMGKDDKKAQIAQQYNDQRDDSAEDVMGKLLEEQGEPEWMKNLEYDVNKASVVVTTPEKLLQDLLSPDRNPWVQRITTLIFDEGHLIGDKSRGPKFEGEQMQLYKQHYQKIKQKVGDAVRIIFMSATMNNATELAAWQQTMTGPGTKWTVVWGEWKPIDVHKEFREFKEDDDDALSMEILIDVASQNNVIMNKNGDRVMRPTLIFVHKIKMGNKLRKMANKDFWHCGYCGGVWYNTGTEKVYKEARCPFCTLGGKTTSWNINFHHANVTPREQDRYVNDFNDLSNNNSTLIATSTLAAGVNTGAQRVIIAGTTRGSEEVESSQINQMIGRAGRQKYLSEFPGEDGKGEPPIVTIYTPDTRVIQDQRRINSGAFLESQMTTHLKIADNLLRAIGTLNIHDARSCGNFIASTFAYFQSQIDDTDPRNIRRGLQAINKSYGEFGDLIKWQNKGNYTNFKNSTVCDHTNIIDITRISEPIFIEGKEKTPKNQMWKFVCQEKLKDTEGNLIINSNTGEPVICGAVGLMNPIHYHDVSVHGDAGFLQDTNRALKDLISSGMATIEKGEYKITSLGRQLLAKSMETATAVDIIKNMHKIEFNPDETPIIELAYALGNLRVNSDTEEGNYISKEQSQACMEVNAFLGINPENPVEPAVKQIQCLYWILNGINLDSKNKKGQKIIPECLIKDYLGITDDYGGIFLGGFDVLSGRAHWFAGAPEEQALLGVQLSFGVSHDIAPFVIADYLWPNEAELLLSPEVGCQTLYDVVANYSSIGNKIEDKLRIDAFAKKLHSYYKQRATTQGKTFTKPYTNYIYMAKKLAKKAKAAMNGLRLKQKGNDYEIDWRQTKIDEMRGSPYKRSVELLNNPENIRKIRQRRSST